MIRTILMIGIGGFFGSIGRYLLSAGMQQFILTAFPLGTLTVNTIGSFLIGLLYGLSERGALLNTDLKLFLTVGFCGGFTTFSTFSHESLMLLRDGQTAYFILYATGSLIAGLTAVTLGYLLSRLI